MTKINQTLNQTENEDKNFDDLMEVDYNTRWKTNGATGILILSGSGT